MIGLVESRSAGGFSEQGKQDYATEELRNQAALMGANGVVLDTTGTETVTGGTYIAQPYGRGMVVPYTARNKTLSGIAIYIY